MPFQVQVKQDEPQSGLKKGDIYVVYHVHWHIATELDPGGFVFFLIYNDKAARFIYEDARKFEEYRNVLIKPI